MEVLKRKAVRAIILTPEGEVLLMRAQEPVSGRNVWFTPGGGLEPDEDPKGCLLRELREEIGSIDLEIGPTVWTRNHTFEWAGRHITQNETFYLARSKRFTPAGGDNPDPIEASAFREFRWWSAGEIIASDDLFAPRRLA